MPGTLITQPWVCRQRLFGKWGVITLSIAIIEAEKDNEHYKGIMGGFCLNQFFSHTFLTWKENTLSVRFHHATLQLIQMLNAYKNHALKYWFKQSRFCCPSFNYSHK